MNSEIFSVAIVVRNEARRLPGLLRRIALSSVRPFEIIVVDNASTDLTQQICLRFSEENPELRLRWRAFSDNNLGRSRAFAIAEAESDYVIFIDADVGFANTLLADLSSSFTQLRMGHPQLAALGASAVMASADPQLDRWLSFIQKGILGHGGSPQAKLFSKSRFVDHVPTTMAIFYRPAVLVVGNFSDRFNSVCEDVDLSYRLRAAGFSLQMSSELRVRHETCGSLLEWSERLWRFGWGQGLVEEHSVESIHKRFWLALAAFHIFVLSMLLSLLVPEFIFINLVYFFSIGIMSFAMYARTRRWVDFRGVLLLYLCTHFSYAWGAAVYFWSVYVPRFLRGKGLRLIPRWTQTE